RDLLPERGEEWARQAGEDVAEGGEPAQEAPEPREVPRMRDPEGGAARQAFEVTDAAELLAQPGPSRGLGDGGAHGVLAAADLREVEERPEEPLPQRARAHGRRGAIEHGQQRAAHAPVLRALEELEGGHGGGVEHQRVAGGETLEPGQVAEGPALSLLQI